MEHHQRRQWARHPDAFLKQAIRVLAFVVAATLIPALGMTIGTVGEEIQDRVAAQSLADQYPIGDPTRCHVAALHTATERLPDLGIEWRWAELDERKAVGTALLESRVVMLDPELDCADVPSVAYHEWTHIAQADHYGGTATLTATVTSDLVDKTGHPHKVAVQEVVADCAAMLLADEFGDARGPRPYMAMLGGCPPDMLAMAREVVTSAGVKLAEGGASPLGAVGSAYRSERGQR